MVLLLAQIIVALAVFIKICIIYVAVIIIWFLTSSWGLVILKYMPCVLQTFIDIPLILVYHLWKASKLIFHWHFTSDGDYCNSVFVDHVVNLQLIPAGKDISAIRILLAKIPS